MGMMNEGKKIPSLVGEGSTILISGPDHTYIPMKIQRVKVVLSPGGEYSEYHGDDYLEPGDQVVERHIAG